MSLNGDTPVTGMLRQTTRNSRLAVEYTTAAPASHQETSPVSCVSAPYTPLA